MSFREHSFVVIPGRVRVAPTGHPLCGPRQLPALVGGLLTAREKPFTGISMAVEAPKWHSSLLRQK